MFRTRTNTHSSEPAHITRRECCRQSIASFGWLGLANLICHAPSAMANPLSLGRDVKTRPPQFPPRAKRMVLLFQHGGPSQIDLFDPKPMLEQYAGKPMPGGVEAFFDKQDSSLCTPSPFKFARHGESGMEFSELLPHLATCADDLCQIRSMHTLVNDHEGALRHFQTGKPRVGRPTIGSWISYALGTVNQNLPPYVVLSDPTYDQVDGIRNWSSGFLPAIYQGTPLRCDGPGLFDLSLPTGVTDEMQREQLSFLQDLNRQHQKRYKHLSELDARIANNALAGNIREEVTAAMDLSRETQATQARYGIDNPATGTYGRRCLMARRLLESGVRFVALFNDKINGDPWDTHDKHNERIRTVTANVDQPSAALIQDLKRTGLLEDTIVLWVGEFGRLPVSQGKDGRDHNRHAFTALVAGGGFKPGLTYGKTDDFGYKIAEKPVAVGELHATLLQQFGLNHAELTYPHQGRSESLTDTDITGVQPTAALVN
ncbi:DUF1501 domain-containing protein [Schlesneria paludicola]|uniref:DUF1501 domain-containing protein n=1 Tax=Schlesneria paludicola TaxID=360056 RepID=UPI00029A92FF|nr:DUF1501 domain-containing protein [Schlesneria paludicola]